MRSFEPGVHPFDVEDPPPPADNNRQVVMEYSQGMPGTPLSLLVRLIHFASAAFSIAAIVVFGHVTPYWYLVTCLSLQCLWSLSLAMVDIYALLVKRCFTRLVGFNLCGDSITSTFMFSGMIVSIAGLMRDCHDNKNFNIIFIPYCNWFLVFLPLLFLNPR